MTQRKKSTEANKLFPLLQMMDSNFILEEVKVKFRDYFRLFIAQSFNTNM